jgi:hypothetical protein
MADTLAVGLVGPVGIHAEFGDEFALAGENAYVAVVDQQEHVASFVGSEYPPTPGQTILKGEIAPVPRGLLALLPPRASG